MVALQAMPVVATAHGKTDRHMDVGNTEKPRRHNYYATDWAGFRTLMERRLSVLFQIGPRPNQPPVKRVPEPLPGVKRRSWR
jgi:hypothetical protein